MKGKIQYKHPVYLPKGYTFNIEHHNDHIGKWYAKDCQTWYELAMLEYIASLGLKEEFIDVGANIGNHSMFFSRVCGNPVWAFEPIPENIKLLKKNVGKDKDIVNIQEMGLSDKKGKAGYEINKGNMGMCKLVKGNDIEISTLDSFFKEDKIKNQPIDLIKIDTETEECKIVKGGLKLIKRCRPHLFIEAQTKVEMRALDQILIPLKYTRKIAFNKTPTYYYDPGSRNIS